MIHMEADIKELHNKFRYKKDLKDEIWKKEIDQDVCKTYLRFAYEKYA